MFYVSVVMDDLDEELRKKFDEFDQMCLLSNDNETTLEVDDNFLSISTSNEENSILSSVNSSNNSCAVQIETTKEDDEDWFVTRKMLGGEQEAESDIPDCCSWKCNKILPKDLPMKFRQKFQELTKSEQSIVVIAHLQAQRQHKKSCS